jgi:cyclopropane fatty-acyl-phospholipid synthase-like methyltransferase
MANFDFNNVFGDDYLHFYGPDLTPERNERETEAIWQILSLQSGQTVLDIGCGHGRIANRLAKRGAQVTGLDANARFLHRARPMRPRPASRSSTCEGTCAHCPGATGSMLL